METEEVHDTHNMYVVLHRYMCSYVYTLEYELHFERKDLDTIP